MKFLAVFVTLAAAAFAYPATTTWTLQELTNALQSPGLDPVLLPYLEAAHNQMMDALFHGHAMETITITMPTVAEYTLNDLSAALQDPNTDPAHIPHLENALNQLMDALWHGSNTPSISVVLPAELPASTSPAGQPDFVDVWPVQVPENKPDFVDVWPVQVPENKPDFVDVWPVQVPQEEPSFIDVWPIQAPQEEPSFIDVWPIQAPQEEPSFIDVWPVQVPDVAAPAAPAATAPSAPSSPLVQIIVNVQKQEALEVGAAAAEPEYDIRPVTGLDI